MRANGDEAHDAIKLILSGADADFTPGSADNTACPILVVATAATDKSRTAKLLLKRKDALVGMFYPPDLSAVAAQVRQMGDAAGLRLNGDLAERIARGAGLDVRLAAIRSHQAGAVSGCQCRIAESSGSGGPRSDRRGDGRGRLHAARQRRAIGRYRQTAGRAERRMREMSLNPVGLLLAFERRAAQLAQIAGKIGSERDISGVLQSEQQARRVFWKDRRDLDTQLRCWHAEARLSRLVERLMQLHRALLTNNQSAQVLLSQGLADITREARRRRIGRLTHPAQPEASVAAGHRERARSPAHCRTG